jgi:hypothetical protein
LQRWASGKASETQWERRPLVPLHFYAAVYGVRGLDATLRAATKGIVDGKIDVAREFRRERGRAGDEEGLWLKEGYHESEYERIVDAAARSATLLLLVYRWRPRRSATPPGSTP